MTTITNTTMTQYNIIGSTGAHEIVTRGATRNGGSDQVIVPGTVMQVDESDPVLCEPWDGTGGQVCGIALEGMTLGTAALPLNILASGSFANEEILIHGGAVPSAAQFNQMQQDAGLVPQGQAYTA
jgi:hypothetical protein